MGAINGLGSAPRRFGENTSAIRDNFSLGVAGGRRGCYPYSLFTILDNLSDLELLRGTFPDLRYVFLTRKDKIRQAVSYDRAIRSGVWWSIPTQANCLTEAPGPAIAPPFDFARYDEWVTRLSEFESNWRCHIKRTGIEALEVAYEDLVESYESTSLTVLRNLDLPVATGSQVAPPRLQRQADLVTEEWVRRYQQLKR